MATSTPKPTDQQAMLIRMATRTRGVTRAEVREALGYEEGANIPVQTMLKKLAERFGYVLETPEEIPGYPGRWRAVYRLVPATKRAAVNVRRAPRKVAAA